MAAPPAITRGAGSEALFKSRKEQLKNCMEWHQNRAPTDPCFPSGMGDHPKTALLIAIAIRPCRASLTPGATNPISAAAKSARTRSLPLHPSSN